MTGMAGNFNTFVACNISIIQIDEEGSVTHDPNLSIFKLRKEIGIKDVDVRSELKCNRIDDAVKKILVELENRIVPKLEVSRRPEIIML